MKDSMKDSMQDGMKHPRTPTPTFAQFQRAHLVEVTRLVWLANCGMHCAAIVRALLTELIVGGHGVKALVGDVGSLLTYTFFHGLPYLSLRAGRIDLVQAACTTTHICLSVLLWCQALGWLPQVAAIKLCVHLHIEVFVELLLIVQYQLSLPLLAILHALRQAGWLSIAVGCMGADPQRMYVRGLFNWLVLMVVSWMVERRMRGRYLKAYPSQQQQQQQQQAQEQQQQPQASSSHRPCWETAMQLPVADKAMHDSGEGGDTAFTKLAAAAGSSGAAGNSLGRRLLEAGATDWPHSSAPGRSPVVIPSLLSAIAPPTRLVALVAPERTTAPLPAMAAKTCARSLGADLPMAHTTPDQIHLRKLPYRRNGQYAPKTVCVKMEGVELEQLPQDLPLRIHEQLSQCMPGVTLTALALRSGCVLMTMDLMCPVDGSEANAATLADDTRRLIARLMQDHSMGHLLEDGAAMTIQVPAGLSFCRWDSDTSTYTLDSVTQTLDALDTATLTNCFLMSAFPAVHCWPDAVQASRQLTLTVELQLPSNCQLNDQQAAAMAAPAGSEEYLGEVTGPVMHATLLARRLDGGYLPVVVERLSEDGMDNDAHKLTAQIQVTMDGPPAAALRLELWCSSTSIDVGQQGGTVGQYTRAVRSTPEAELLVSHMPLLMLPGSWKEAAAELQQHVKDMGGVQPHHAAPPPHAGTGTRLAESGGSNLPTSHWPVDEPEDGTCSLLEDLGTWLTYHQRHPSSHTEQDTAAASDGVISGIGDDLLIYAVQHGLGAVAGMIVDTMQRAEQQSAQLPGTPGPIVNVPDSTPSAWWLRVVDCNAGGSKAGVLSAMQADAADMGGCDGMEHMGLIHAAMASGNSDILAQVLRWGTLYGGPDWAWPWELEDATGRTALHLAAAQPAAGACAALLKTITCMLPAGQVQAARNAWMNCQGGIGVTPASLLERTSPASRHVWGSEGSSQATDAAGCSSENRSDSAMSMGSAAAHPLSPSSQITGQDQSWLHSVVAVWRLPETDECRAWATKQMRHIRLWWVAVTSIIVAVCMYRSALTGCLQYEYLHISLQGFAYMPLVASTSWGSWISKRQAWLLSPYVLYCSSYYAKASLPSTCMPLWIAAGTTSAEALFVLVIDAPMDQAALPVLLVARSVMAYFQGLAFRAIGVPFSLPRAILIQVAALVVATLCRARQRRAFQRWQATKDRSRPSATGKGGQQEEGQCAAAGWKKDN